MSRRSRRARAEAYPGRSRTTTAADAQSPAAISSIRALTRSFGSSRKIFRSRPTARVSVSSAAVRASTGPSVVSAAAIRSRAAVSTAGWAPVGEG